LDPNWLSHPPPPPLLSLATRLVSLVVFLFGPFDWSPKFHPSPALPFRLGVTFNVPSLLPGLLAWQSFVLPIRCFFRDCGPPPSFARFFKSLFWFCSFLRAPFEPHLFLVHNDHWSTFRFLRCLQAADFFYLSAPSLFRDLLRLLRCTFETIQWVPVFLLDLLSPPPSANSLSFLTPNKRSALDRGGCFGLFFKLPHLFCLVRADFPGQTFP